MNRYEPSEEASQIENDFLAMVFGEMTNREILDKVYDELGKPRMTDEEFETHVKFTKAIFGVSN